MEYTIKPIHPYKAILGEGPVWDPASKSILWIDIIQFKILELNTQSSTYRSIDTGSMVGSFALCNDGNLIAAVQEGFVFINRSTGLIEKISDPEEEKKGNRFNDGKCDPAGRFWAGTMSLNEQDNSGSLYTIDSQKNIEKKIDGVTISNGLCWNLDETKFYYIDTPTMEVVQFDFNKEAGYISNKKTIIRIAQEDGYPDGMTIDHAGMLWIAHWGGWQITRWDPSTGKKIHRIQMPVSKITSICFGGEDFSDIYVTSANIALTNEELEKEPLAGSTFVIKNTGFKGLPLYEYKIS
jgi:sugar lactone lactonase YvrE